MKWQEIQAFEQSAPARPSADGAKIRAALLASGTLREPPPLPPEPPPVGTVLIDELGLNDAARTIWAVREGNVLRVIANADPRVGAQLRLLAAQRGVRLEASC